MYVMDHERGLGDDVKWSYTLAHYTCSYVNYSFSDLCTGGFGRTLFGLIRMGEYCAD